MSEGDPEYDATFRAVLKVVAAHEPAVCALCGLEFGAHAIAAYLGDLNYYFEEQSQN